MRFSIRAARVEVSSDTAKALQLQSLRSRFVTSSSISNVAFDVDIDDFLVNLNELAHWPLEDAEIRWQPELLVLVESNAVDADTMRLRLDNQWTSDNATPMPEVSWPLTSFQRRDIAKLLGLQHGANFSVPGAGKTRVALSLFEARRSAGQIERALVVCPKSAFDSWQTEAALCFRDSPLRISISDGDVLQASDILLINYERLVSARTNLLAWLRGRPSLLILDEAHRTKRGAAGAWGSVCLSLAPYARHRLILTGTPAPNGARDLENLLAFVWPGQGRATVARAIDGNDLRTASTILRPLFVRTTKDELQLPPVERVVRRVDLPPLHRELYNALLGQASAEWLGGSGDLEDLGRILLYLLMAATTPALLATGSSRYEPLPYRLPPLEPPKNSSLGNLLRDLPSYELSPKYKAVLEIVSRNAAAGRKTLIWSTFVRNLTSLHSLLSAYNPALVHGGTVDRFEELRRFREDPTTLVLLSNPATLGEGLSLHHVCHDAIYVDRDFAAGRFMQSLDRIHRLGLAANTVTRVTVLVANATIDEMVEQRLAIKLQFMGGILNDDAVLQLADLEEEPDAAAGMDSTDLQSLLGYLSRAAL